MVRATGRFGLQDVNWICVLIILGIEDDAIELLNAADALYVSAMFGHVDRVARAWGRAKVAAWFTVESNARKLPRGRDEIVEWLEREPLMQVHGPRRRVHWWPLEMRHWAWVPTEVEESEYDEPEVCYEPSNAVIENVLRYALTSRSQV